MLWKANEMAFDFDNTDLVSQKLWDAWVHWRSAFNLLKYFLCEFIWCQCSEEQVSQTASLVVMELFNRLILCLTQRKQRWELRPSLQNYTMWYAGNIRFIHIHSLMRMDLLCMKEIYNMSSVCFAYWAENFSDSCNF